MAKPVAIYPYRDASKQLVRQKLRFPDKRFMWQHPTEGGPWVDNAGEEPPILYRLPELMAARRKRRGAVVWVTEGEKDADALVACGHVATCPPDNAPWPPGLAKPLAGGRVRLLWDRDADGHKRGHWALRALRAVGARVTCWRAAQGKDVADHLAAGLKVEELVQEDPPKPEPGTLKTYEQNPQQVIATLVAEAGDAGPMVAKVLAHMVDENKLNGQVLLWPRDLKLRPPRKWLIEQVVPENAVVVVYAEPGVGKTTLNDDWSDAISRGSGWNGYPTQQGTVLTLTGEDIDQHTVRLQALDQLRGVQEEGHAYLEHEWNITTLEGMAKLVHYIYEAERHTGRPVVLVNVDPVGLYGTRNHDGIEDTEPMSRALRALATGLDICVVAWQHANASGMRARGTEHLRMYCDVYARMETIGNDVTWMHDGKNKRGRERAMRFERQHLTEDLYYLELKRGGPNDMYTPQDVARERAETRDEGKEKSRIGRAENPDLQAKFMAVLPALGQPGMSGREASVRADINHVTGGTILEVMARDGLVFRERGKGNKVLHWKAHE